jgi:hypothetical protein
LYYLAVRANGNVQRENVACYKTNNETCDEKERQATSGQKINMLAHKTTYADGLKRIRSDRADLESKRGSALV